MCRALLYLGEPVLLDNLLFQPDSALVRQSYMPKMLNLLNLAGFGLRAWDPASHAPRQPFFYGSPSLPVFDRNLKNLAEKVRAGCVLAHVRGVAYSPTIDISLQNVHPFQFEGIPWALAHNGDLAGMEQMKPLLAPDIRPDFLPRIRGNTDSEWIYALFVSQLRDPTREAEESEVFDALERTLGIIRSAREKLGIDISSSVNLFIANGTQAAALRFGLGGNAQQNDATDYVSGGFKVQVLYLRYVQPEREVKFYLGAGPEGGYALSRSDVAPAVTRRDAQWTLGVAGRLGTEWFATKHVSLFAEYGNLLGTEHRAHREADHVGHVVQPRPGAQQHVEAHVLVAAQEPGRDEEGGEGQHVLRHLEDPGHGAQADVAPHHVQRNAQRRGAQEHRGAGREPLEHPVVHERHLEKSFLICGACSGLCFVALAQAMS